MLGNLHPGPDVVGTRSSCGATAGTWGADAHRARVATIIKRLALIRVVLIRHVYNLFWSQLSSAHTSLNLAPIGSARLTELRCSDVKVELSSVGVNSITCGITERLDHLHGR